MTRLMRAWPIAAALLCAVSVSPAAADDDVPGAAKAYSQAQAAAAGGDHGLAAEMFELADSLAPSAVALRNATREHFAANHLAIAATLATELAHRYPDDKESREVAETILAQVGPTLTAIDVKCSETCTILLDGKAVFAKARDQYSFFTRPGARHVDAEFSEGRTVRKEVTALVNQPMHVDFQAPPKPVVAAPPTKTPELVTRPAHGVSRAWVLIGGLATAGLAGGAVGFGLETLDTKNKIVAANTAGDLTTRDTLYNKGVDQQRYTNIFIGAAGVVGLATIVTMFFTNWSGQSTETETPVAIVPSAQGASLVYSGAF